MTFETDNVPVVPTTAPDNTTTIAVAVVVAVIFLVIFLIALAYFLRSKKGDQSNFLTEEMVPITLEKASSYVAFNSHDTVRPEYQVSDEVRRGDIESDESASLREDQSKTPSSETRSRSLAAAAAEVGGHTTPLTEVLSHSLRPTSSAEAIGISSTIAQCSHDPSPPPPPPPMLLSNGLRSVPPSLGLTVVSPTSNELQTGSRRSQTPSSRTPSSRTPSPIATNPYVRSPFKEKPIFGTLTGSCSFNEIFPGVDKLSHNKAQEKSIESFVSQWDNSSSSPLPPASDSCSGSASCSNLAPHKESVTHQTLALDLRKSDLVSGNFHSSPRNLAPQDDTTKPVKTTKNYFISEDDISKSCHDSEDFPSDIESSQKDFNCTPSDDQCFTQFNWSRTYPTLLTPDDAQQVQHFTSDSSFEVDPLCLQDHHSKQDLVDKKTWESSTPSPKGSLDSMVVDSSSSMAWDSSCDILTVSTREPSPHPSFHQDGQLAGKLEQTSIFLTPKEDASQDILSRSSSRNRSFSRAIRDGSVLSGRSDVYTTGDESFL